MPFVSQMFGLVMEAESSAGGALAFGRCCSSGKGGRQPWQVWLPAGSGGIATHRPGRELRQQVTGMHEL